VGEVAGLIFLAKRKKKEVILFLDFRQKLTGY
jgi:hypothetical protein